MKSPSIDVYGSVNLITEFHRAEKATYQGRLSILPFSDILKDGVFPCRSAG